MCIVLCYDIRSGLRCQTEVESRTQSLTPRPKTQKKIQDQEPTFEDRPSQSQDRNGREPKAQFFQIIVDKFSIIFLTQKCLR